MFKKIFHKKTKKESSSAGRAEIQKTSSFFKKGIFSWFWKIAVFLLMVAGVLAALSFWSSLTIKAVIGQQVFKIEEKIEVSAAADSFNLINLTEKIVGGRFVEEKAEGEEIFLTTGRQLEEGKAKGRITVYNNHSPAKSLSFVAQTRFLSAQEGRIFKAQEKVFIPAAKEENGKLEPGSVEIEVIAEEAGEEYNIGPSQFSVPGLSGTAFYYNIWAESSGNMSGGFKKESPMVSQDDIIQAKKELTEELNRKAAALQREKLEENFILNEKALFSEEAQISCSAKEGEAVEQFNCSGSGSFTWMVFNFSQIKELADEMIAQKTSSTEKIRPETLEITVEPKTILLEKEKMLADLLISAKSYRPLQEDIFKTRVSGQSEQEIRNTVFENYPQIREVEFDFWPFWVKKAPGKSERITLEIDFILDEPAD